MTTVQSIAVHDIRFPTSRELDGSDAMNPDPDYSVAYLEIATTDPGLRGHSFVFTIGRGNDIQTGAVAALADRLVGRDVDGLCEAPQLLNNDLAWDSQLRWLGPDKGVVHMAVGAVVNAVWDLRSRREGQPLWRSVVALDPAELAGLVDWSYLRDYLDPGLAREMLEDVAPQRALRIEEFSRHGVEAYTTSPGWLGYSDDKLRRLCSEATGSGFRTVKLKVGGDPARDEHRLSIAREVLGEHTAIAVDANQRWSVDEAITAILRLRRHGLRWVEEPTHPDDVVGHSAIAKAVAPIAVATGEHLANPVMGKQLLQLGGAQILQIDATRVGGVHELLALMLLARHAGVNVIPHAGGIGLCEAVQHYAFINAIAVAEEPDGALLEYVDHLHEHMLDPVRLDHGHYLLPTTPGSSTALTPQSIARFSYPHGLEWETQRPCRSRGGHGAAAPGRLGDDVSR